jgi:copper oxidase (laccase) domain-containing protein
VREIISETIRVMHAEYCSEPANLLSAVGPSIARHHYPVGSEVIDAIHKTFGDEASGLFSQEGEEYFLDLWEAARIQLKRAGIRRIENPEICTACHPEDWFSHRGEAGKTGRFGALITIDRIRAYR